jgi:leucyl-tRNA synthetase
LFGATYFVVAPEHDLITNYKLQITNFNEVEEYINKAKSKSDLERTDLAKDKTGVKLEGIVAINPVNNKEMPIFVADYVLAGYGTGAIMAVPAHDERDFEFAKKFDLLINEVVAKETGTRVGDEIKKRGGCAIVFDPKEQKYALLKRADGMFAFYSGGANENESLFDCVQRELREEGGFHNFETVEPLAHAYTNYYNSVKKHRVCGLALCNLVVLKNTDRLPLKLEEHESGFETVWATPDEILKNWQKFSYGDGSLDHWRWFLNLGVARLKELQIDKQAYKNNFKKEIFTDEGVAINSGFLDGLKTADAKETMISWLEERGLGERAINYKIKDWVFSRQRYWGEPIPLVYCEHCHDEVLKIWKEQGVDFEKTKQAEISNFQFPISKHDKYNKGELMNPGWIEDSVLPLELPEVESYEPSGTGESPLANMTEWLSVKCPKCGGAAKRETNTMPQWAGSSWYYLRFVDPYNDEALIDKARDKYWSPVDFYVGGAEHATRHLIYARFWHKFLYDIGVLNYDEPFKRLQHVGLIMAEDGRKMSKRWGNVINPDQIVEQHGADAMRVYEMFMGPFSQAVAWSTNGLIGARKFLERIYKLNNLIADNQDCGHLDNLLHKTIKKVGEDIEAFRFNTAVSSLMILLNEVEKIGCLNKAQYKNILLLLAPFAPHLAEELWFELEADNESIFKQAWPEYDSELMKDKLITLAIQVNGKLRDTIEVDAEISEEEAKQFALNSAKVKKWTDGQEIIKVVYVKGKLVSIVVKN